MSVDKPGVDKLFADAIGEAETVRCEPRHDAVGDRDANRTVSFAPRRPRQFGVGTAFRF